MGTNKYIKKKIMGSVYSYIFGGEETPEQTESKPQENQASSIKNEDMVVLKMKIQKDKFFNKINTSEKHLKELEIAILNLIKQGNDQKQEAKYKIVKKKTLESA